MGCNKLFIAIAVLAIIIFDVGCKKYLDDAYADPNNPIAVDPDFVFPVMISNMARGVQYDSRILNSYVQYWARTDASNTWDMHGYFGGNDLGLGGERWRQHYFGFGHNLLNIIRDGRNSGRPAYSGAGYAIFAWSWLLLTDYHGEVILKEAFREDQLTFKYDAQPEVYDYVKVLADSALYYLNMALTQAPTSFSTGDQNLYGGDINKWFKFTYAVKAMVYHRYVLKENYIADSVIINADKSFSSSSDDAMVKFPLNNVVEQENSYGPRRNILGAMRPSDFVIRLMNGAIFSGAIDPRMKFLFKPAQDDQYRGLEPGRGQTVLAENQRPPSLWGLYSSSPSPGGVDSSARSYFKNNSFFPILTYSQLQFIKAEAAFKKGDKATALTAYINGINGSFDHLQQYYTSYSPISDSDRTAFLTNTSVVPLVDGELTLNNIMLQKYLALWPYNSEETWVDLRKYQYKPSVYSGWVFPATFFVDNGGLPAQRVRPAYHSEYLWNVEALRSIGALEINYHTKPVWFSLP